MEPLNFLASGDPQAVVITVNTELARQGYKVTPSPDGWSGAAEVGSAVGRVLGGGFVRRNKLEYQVTQTPTEGQWMLVVTPAMTGAGGGALGMSKAKKEMRNVKDGIGQALTNSGQFISAN